MKKNKTVKAYIEFLKMIDFWLPSKQSLSSLMENKLCSSINSC